MIFHMLSSDFIIISSITAYLLLFYKNVPTWFNIAQLTSIAGILTIWSYVFILQFVFIGERWTISFLTKFNSAAEFARIAAIIVYPLIFSLYIYSFFQDDLSSSTSLITFNEAWYTFLISFFTASITVGAQYGYHSAIKEYLELEV